MSNRLTRPETLTALGIVVVAAGFLVPAAALRPISALLPVAMLIGLIVLSVVLLISDQRKAAAGEAAQPMTKSPKRVFGAFALIVAYALATDFIGFYVSTVVAVPLIVCVILAWKAKDLTLSSFSRNRFAATVLRTPLWIPQLIPPVGFCVIGIFLVEQFLLTFRKKDTA